MLSKPDYLEGGGGEFHLAGARVDVHLLEMGVNVIHMEQRQGEKVPLLFFRSRVFLLVLSFYFFRGGFLFATSYTAAVSQRKKGKNNQ